MTDVARGSTPQVDKPQRAGARGHVPGDSSMWFFVIGDLLIFGGYFVGYMYYRGRNHGLFLAGQAQLNLNIGTVNTIVLLTSSWFIARSVQAVRAGDPGRALNQDPDGAAARASGHWSTPWCRRRVSWATSACSVTFGLRPHRLRDSVAVNA